MWNDWTAEDKASDLAKKDAQLKRAREATTPTGRGSLQARLEQQESALTKIDTTEASRIEAAKQKSANTLELLNMEQLGLEKESAVNQRLMTTNIEKLVKEATAPSESLRVHDVHLERLLAPVPVQLGALLGSLGALNSGGGTTINNVTVAPSTSNTVSSVQKSENTYGTVDPYTAAAGAYG